LAQKNEKNVFPASVAGISVGDISKDVLLNTGVIECSDPKVVIIGFEMSALKNGDLVVFKENGNTLTEQMKMLIKNMEIGNKLIFEEITAKTGEDKIIKLNAIILTIK
jgi:hypothetical protein